MMIMSKLLLYLVHLPVIIIALNPDPNPSKSLNVDDGKTNTNSQSNNVKFYDARDEYDSDYKLDKSSSSSFSELESNPNHGTSTTQMKVVDYTGEITDFEEEDTVSPPASPAPLPKKSTRMFRSEMDSALKEENDVVVKDIHVATSSSTSTARKIHDNDNADNGKKRKMMRSGKTTSSSLKQDTPAAKNEPEFIYVEEDPLKQPCGASYCNNHGKLVSDSAGNCSCKVSGSAGNCSCKCNVGWFGETCNLIKCRDPYCNNHGTVSGYVGNCSCSCHDGWSGATCNIKQPCSASLCNNHGTVSGTSVGYCSCKCYDGWSGETCNIKQSCGASLQHCNYNGKLVYDSAGNCSCKCNVGWFGETCNLIKCRDPYCNNHGTVSGYVGNCSCSCHDGWSGATCNIKQPCSASLCNNHGTVSGTSVGNCSCKCYDGWSGDTCNIKQSCGAFLHNCNYNGKASGSFPNCSCKCNVGWFGETCNLIKCRAPYCNNHGTVSGYVGNCSCSCDDGWSGKTCNTQNVYETISANTSDKLETLKACIDKVGLQSFFEQPDKQLTVFAPSDDALKKLSDDVYKAADSPGTVTAPSTPREICDFLYTELGSERLKQTIKLRHHFIPTTIILGSP